MLSKKLAAIDKTRCVACGVCENTCPLGAVKVRRGCYAAVEAERCVGCGKRVEKDKPHHYVGPTKAAVNLVYVF